MHDSSSETQENSPTDGSNDEHEQWSPRIILPKKKRRIPNFDEKDAKAVE